jgi:hypothetical protein
MDVLGFVRTAGFDRDQARTATALAMAASNGADHHWWHPDDAPTVDQRGLFALDVRHVGADDARSLFDPQINAEWTKVLFDHWGQTWVWHPVASATKGAVVRATLMALDSDRGWMDRPGQFFGRTAHIAKPWRPSNLVPKTPKPPEAIAPVESEFPWPTATP